MEPKCLKPSERVELGELQSGNRHATQLMSRSGCMYVTTRDERFLKIMHTVLTVVAFTYKDGDAKRFTPMHSFVAAATAATPQPHLRSSLLAHTSR
jgi:hypothetical protein